MSALTSLLVRDDVVSVRQIEDALSRQVLEGGELDTALLELVALPENLLIAYRAASFRALAVSREELMGASAATRSLLLPELAAAYEVVPVTHDATTLVVASDTPLADDKLAELAARTGFRIECRVTSELRISAALAEFYGVTAAPRLRELAARVDALEPGELAAVPPLQVTPTATLSSDLLQGFDESEDFEAALEAAFDRVSAVPSRRTSGPLTGRLLEVAPPSAARPVSSPRSAPIDPGHAAIPPPATKRALSPRSAPIDFSASAPPARAASRPLAADGGKRSSQRPARPKRSRAVRAGQVRIPKGPLTAAAAIEILEKADERDAVIEVFFRYARQYFDATALFSVRDDRALGLEAYNISNIPDVREVSIALTRGSALEDLVRSLLPRVLDLSRKDEDRPIAEALDRLDAQPSALVPVCIKRRVVSFVYGDRAGEPFALEDLASLVGLLPHVSRAFERIIRTRKVMAVQTSRSLRPRQPTGAGDLTVGHAMTQQELPVGPATDDNPASVARSAPARSSAPRSVPPPSAALGPDPAADGGVLALADARTKQAMTALGVPRTAPPPPSPRVRQRTPMIGVPFAERAAGLDRADPARPLGDRGNPIGERADPARPNTDRADYARPNAPRADPASSNADRVDRARPSTERRTASFLDRAEPAKPPSDRAEPAKPPSDRAERADPLAARAEAKPPSDRPESAPTVDSQPMAQGPRPSLPPTPFFSKPPPGTGRYNSRDSVPPQDSQRSRPKPAVPSAGEDTQPVRRGRPFRAGRSNPPEHSRAHRAALDSHAAAADGGGPMLQSPVKRSSPPPPNDVDATRSSPPPAAELHEARGRPARSSKPPPGAGSYRSHGFTTELISVPKPDAGKARPQPPAEEAFGMSVPAPRAANPPLPSPPPLTASDDTPHAEVLERRSQLTAAMTQLVKTRPEDDGTVIQYLVRLGDEALDALCAQFPGPLWFDRRQVHSRVPLGRDISPIARALVAFGDKAYARFPALLRSAHPDVRYYATLFVSDRVYPPLLEPLIERLFDEDPQIRLMVRDTLPHYRRVVGFSKVADRLRTQARDPAAPLKARLAALDAISVLRDASSVSILIDLINDSDKQISVPAYRALVAITCQDFGKTVKKWRAWYEPNAARHRVEWLIESLMHSEQALRGAAGLELQKVTQVYYGYVAAAPKREREQAQKRYWDWWHGEGRGKF